MDRKIHLEGDCVASQAWWVNRMMTQNFLSVPHTHGRFFFFLHIFCFPKFDFKQNILLDAKYGCWTLHVDIILTRQGP